MLEHGFNEDEVLAQKELPDEPKVDLPNTWNRLKGKKIALILGLTEDRLSLDSWEVLYH